MEEKSVIEKTAEKKEPTGRSLKDTDVAVRHDLLPRSVRPRVVANGQNQQNYQNN